MLKNIVTLLLMVLSICSFGQSVYQGKTPFGNISIEYQYTKGPTGGRIVNGYFKKFHRNGALKISGQKKNDIAYGT